MKNYDITLRTKCAATCHLQTFHDFPGLESKLSHLITVQVFQDPYKPSSDIHPISGNDNPSPIKQTSVSTYRSVSHDATLCESQPQPRVHLERLHRLYEAVERGERLPTMQQLHAHVVEQLKVPAHSDRRSRLTFCEAFNAT